MHYLCLFCELILQLWGVSFARRSGSCCLKELQNDITDQSFSTHSRFSFWHEINIKTKKCSATSQVCCVPGILRVVVFWRQDPNHWLQSDKAWQLFPLHRVFAVLLQVKSSFVPPLEVRKACNKVCFKPLNKWLCKLKKLIICTLYHLFPLSHLHSWNLE